MRFTARTSYIDFTFWQPDTIYPDDVHVDNPHGIYELDAAQLAAWQEALDDLSAAYQRVYEFSRTFRKMAEPAT